MHVDTCGRSRYVYIIYIYYLILYCIYYVIIITIITIIIIIVSYIIILSYYCTTILLYYHILYYCIAILLCYHILSYYYTQTPRFSQAQNSVNTREFCTTSNNGKDFMFNYVARVLTRICCLYISYNQNMRVSYRVSYTVSYRVSRRYQCPPVPWNN